MLLNYLSLENLASKAIGIVGNCPLRFRFVQSLMQMPLKKFDFSFSACLFLERAWPVDDDVLRQVTISENFFSSDN
jgi:hypothetical protein